MIGTQTERELREPAEWCDVHRGHVDEGQTRSLTTDSMYRICSACADDQIAIGGLAARTDQLALALYVLNDATLPIVDRAAAYAVLHQLQLRVNRLLRPVTAELTAHLRDEGLRSLGPVSLKSRPRDVRWPCNDEDNWTDDLVQDTLHELMARSDTRRYVRSIPSHLEIDTRAIAEGFAEGDPLLPALHRELTRKGFRTADDERAYSLSVRDVA